MPARIAPALLAVAALAAVVTGCSAVDEATKTDVAKTKVGDCISITNNSTTATEGDPMDCSSPKAVYKVFQTFDAKTECASEYTSYTEELVSGGTAFLCLAPNFQQDSCYNDVSTSPYKWVDCTSPDATFKVLQRVDGQDDEMLCGETAEQFITVPDPKTLYCVGKP